MGTQDGKGNNGTMLPLQTGTQGGTKAQRNIAASCPDEQNSTNGTNGCRSTMAQVRFGHQ